MDEMNFTYTEQVRSAIRQIASLRIEEETLLKEKERADEKSKAASRSISEVERTIQLLNRQKHLFKTQPLACVDRHAVLSQTHRDVSQKLQIAESELQEATTAASLVANTKRIKSA